MSAFKATCCSQALLPKAVQQRPRKEMSDFKSWGSLSLRGFIWGSLHWKENAEQAVRGKLSMSSWPITPKTSLLNLFMQKWCRLLPTWVLSSELNFAVERFKKRPVGLQRSRILLSSRHIFVFLRRNALGLPSRFHRLNQTSYSLRYKRRSWRSYDTLHAGHSSSIPSWSSVGGLFVYFRQ